MGLGCLSTIREEDITKTGAVSHGSEVYESETCVEEGRKITSCSWGGLSSPWLLVGPIVVDEQGIGGRYWRY